MDSVSAAPFHISVSMIDEIFLSLFAVTFIVALVAFGAYGYLLVNLLRHHSEKYNPTTPWEFLRFLWQLLIFYVHRSMSGFLGIRKGESLPFIETHNREIRRAESEHKKLINIYRVFSSAYILFFFLLICLFITLLYMIAGAYL